MKRRDLVAEHFTSEQRAAVIAAYPDHERDARARGIPMLGSGRVFPVPEGLIREESFAIPRDWPGFHIELRPSGGPTRYDIRVENAGAGGEPAEVRLDGRVLQRGQDAARIPLAEDGRTHHVWIRLA
jgi:hypothetical protein